ncbi:MAG: hypothetical protein AAF984_06715 [Verrucomicrobiota bacterium]
MSDQTYPTRLELDIPNEWNLSVVQTDESPIVMKVNAVYQNFTAISREA